MWGAMIAYIPNGHGIKISGGWIFITFYEAISFTWTFRFYKHMDALKCWTTVSREKCDLGSKSDKV